jgi:hypothetical protein
VSDSYSIQDVGGAELARHYPDRGVLADADYHRAVLTAGKRACGWRRLFAKSERFFAVLSASKDGLRLLVSLDKFAVFLPWSAVTASGERATPGTVVHLQTAAVPSLDLELHLDDEAADALFSGVLAPLPRRDPPGRLYWPKPWAVCGLLGIMLAVAVVLAVLKLPWLVSFAVVGVLSVVLSVALHVCRPLFEEDRHRAPPGTRRGR